MSHQLVFLFLGFCQNFFDFILLFKLTFKNSVMLIHQPIFVIHNVVCSCAHPCECFILRLSFLQFLLQSLFFVWRRNLLLIVLKCQIIQSFCLLHNCQLMLVAVPYKCGRCTLLCPFILFHIIVPHFLLLHLIKIHILHIFFLFFSQSSSPHFMLLSDFLIPFEKLLVNHFFI